MAATPEVLHTRNLRFDEGLIEFLVVFEILHGQLLPILHNVQRILILLSLHDEQQEDVEQTEENVQEPQSNHETLSFLLFCFILVLQAQWVQGEITVSQKSATQEFAAVFVDVEGQQAHNDDEYQLVPCECTVQFGISGGSQPAQEDPSVFVRFVDEVVGDDHFYDKNGEGALDESEAPAALFVDDSEHNSQNHGYRLHQNQRPYSEEFRQHRLILLIYSMMSYISHYIFKIVPFGQTSLLWGQRSEGFLSQEMLRLPVYLVVQLLNAHAAAQVGQLELSHQLGEGLGVAPGYDPVRLTSRIYLEFGTPGGKHVEYLLVEQGGRYDGIQLNNLVDCLSEIFEQGLLLQNFGCGLQRQRKHPHIQELLHHNPAVAENLSELLPGTVESFQHILHNLVLHVFYPFDCAQRDISLGDGIQEGLDLLPHRIVLLQKHFAIHIQGSRLQRFYILLVVQILHQGRVREVLLAELVQHCLQKEGMGLPIVEILQDQHSDASIFIRINVEPTAGCTI